MSLELISKVINSIGLIFDIFGAWFVAWEVIRRFNGEQYSTSVTIEVITLPPNKTTEYEKYERNKYRKMCIGLILLTIGFLFQIGSNWIYCLQDNARENPKAISETIKPIKPIIPKVHTSSPKPITVNEPKPTKPIPDK